MKIPEGWPTDEMTQAGFAALPEGFNKIGYDVLRSVFKAMIEAAPTPPAQEDEPVAIIKVMNSFGLDVYEAELTDAGVNLPEGTKLYTRPDNSNLRKAAEEVLRFFDSSSRYSVGFELSCENLRAALEGR